jgi:DNA modification methylase
MSGPWEILEGDAYDVLRTLPDCSVQCCVTSPPYWGLRCYGVDGQIGLEQTPQEFIGKLVDMFREVRRVLRDDGVCLVNMGDSYAHNGPCGGSSPDGPRKPRATDAEKQKYMNYRVPPGLKPKDLCGVPWRLAFALQDDGWYLRQDIIWAKPNPMPESVRDRCTKAHEYIFLLTKKARYFWDAEAVAEMASIGANGSSFTSAYDVATKPNLGQGDRNDTGTRNKRSVWTIPTQGFSEAHFATFPIALPTICIQAGTSERGCCSACGAPWRRVVSQATGGDIGKSWHDHNADDVRGNAKARGAAAFKTYQPPTTTGWEPTCKCEADTVPCMVLDPFAGAGTTLLAARRLGRRAIGIELNPEYAAMARKRIVDDAPLLNG